MPLRKICLYAMLPLLLFLSCGRRGGNEPASDRGLRVIKLSDSLIMFRGADTIDMGRVTVGEVVTADMAVRNDDRAPMVIIAVDKTCGCVDVEYSPKPLKPGEQAGMRLTFVSAGLSGVVYKTVALRTSLDAKPYTLVVTAEVE